MGDLHVNISDLHDKFGDDLGCDDRQYFDEFGDVVDDSGHNGASVLNADVKMEEITTEDEGNPIDLTHEIMQTNTSDLNSITSTNTRNVDTDVKIVSDLADLEDGIEIPESYHHEKRPRKLKYREKSINYVKFVQMDSVLVDEIPWDVDRDQKYRIECEEEDYIDKAKDGRWFQMHTSSRKGLVGKRKVGTCQGSLMCENMNRPKLLSEGIPNMNEFTKDSNVDVCKCCGYYVYHAYCGALKVIEYDRETSIMTILYQGEHNCRLKPNRRKKFDEIRDLTKNDTSIQTLADARRQVIKSLLAKGKVSEAVRIYIQSQKATMFNDVSSYNKIMGATNSLDCKNAARTIKNFDQDRWEKTAETLCKAGIKAKFSQNQYLLEVLTKKTSNKTLVECANDRLWANGVPLYNDSCLDRQRWISQGLLGKLLEEVRSELSGAITADKQPSLSMNTDTIAVSTTPIPVLVNTTTTINLSGFAEPTVEPMAQECEISDSNSS